MQTQGRIRQILFQAGVISCLWLVSCNPFAPGYEEGIVDPQKLLGNRTSINGLFEYFRNTYELRDSLLYGKMLDQSFVFSYPDPSNNNEIFWNRDQDMVSTYKLFMAARQVSLIWNSYYDDTISTDTVGQASRYFNLTLVFEDQNVARVTGRATLQFKRKVKGDNWRITRWRDETNGK